MAARKFILAVAVLGLFGCGGGVWEQDEDVADNEPLAEDDATVIVGTVNWRSTTTLTAGSAAANNAKAVGYLSVPAKRSRCTAWLIGRDLLVTNHHCVATQAEATGARVSFNYVDGVSASSRIWYSCGTLVGAWKDIDAAVLHCSPRNGVLPGEAQGWLKLADRDAATSQSVYVIHQNCDYYSNSSCTPTKKYSPGSVKSAFHSSTEISYTADTLGGSSGSAVFATSGTGTTHRVVALHHAGINGDANGRGTANTGIKVSLLKKRLVANGML